MHCSQHAVTMWQCTPEAHLTMTGVRVVLYAETGSSESLARRTS